MIKTILTKHTVCSTTTPQSSSIDIAAFIKDQLSSNQTWANEVTEQGRVWLWGC